MSKISITLLVFNGCGEFSQTGRVDSKRTKVFWEPANRKNSGSVILRHG